MAWIDIPINHIAFDAPVKLQETVKSIGADAVLDTRLDPLLPRNAVYVKGSI